MGGVPGDSAFRGLEFSQLFNRPYVGMQVGPRVPFFGSAGPTAIPATSNANITVTATLPDAIRSQQDGYLFDYLFARLLPNDTTGLLALTDLQCALILAAGVVPVAFIAGAFPTLNNPRNAHLIPFQNPPLLTGDEMLFFGRLIPPGAGFVFPQTGMRISLSATFNNPDAAAHSMTVQMGGWVHKVTGIAEG